MLTVVAEIIINFIKKAMYSRLLANYPLTTKCITSGFMFSLGDAITQKGKLFVT